MLSSKKLVDDTGEKAFSGYDVKFSGGNRIVDGFLLVAQWQFYREFAIVCGIDGVVFSTELEIYRWGKHMLSSKKLVDDTGEKAFSGYDVKFSGQAPYLPWAKIKGTYYHWDTISGPDIKVITLYPSKCT
jgi:hypothetical protein